MAVELKENEVVEKEFASDYWTTFLCFMEQNRGVYRFTDSRIIFSGHGRSAFSGRTDIEIAYEDIESIQKCCVGPLIRFVPCGIKVTLKDGKVHYLSVTKRKEIMELIQSRIS